ncbi:MAG: hypothetical protein QCI38_08645, partial [Candidatus Thermoplasmatota archaeon]|nr:hypothetical protein [Candidatus Thermoplasmatota archaeon]
MNVIQNRSAKANELKLKTAFIVFLLVGAMIPGILLAYAPETKGAESMVDGTWVIDGVERVIDETTEDPFFPGTFGQYSVYSNISVRNGATLRVTNATLQLLPDVGPDMVLGTPDDRVFWISVSGGGKLILDNAKITLSPNRIMPIAWMNMTISGANSMIASSASSEFSFAGWLNVTDGASAYFNETTFKPLNILSGNFPQVYNNAVLRDAHDDSPQFYFNNANVVFADSRVENYYENTNPAGVPATVDCDPVAKGAQDDTGSNLTHLFDAGVNFYDVAPGQVMHIQGFDTTGVASTGSVYLFVRFDMNETNEGTNVIEWSLDGITFNPTTIIPDNTTWPTYIVVDLHAQGVDTIGEISNLHVRYQNDDDFGIVSFDRIFVRSGPAPADVRFYPIVLEDGTSLTAINT